MSHVPVSTLLIFSSSLSSSSGYSFAIGILTMQYIIEPLADMSCANCIACDAPSLLFTSLDRIICLIMFVIPASAASFAAGSQTL